MKRRAFTLIELLVVIAIIAILAAILFPVFAQARDKARQASCLSNARQIAVAIQTYAQDYDETLPNRTVLRTLNPNTEITFRMLVQPYVKNIQVFTCPSNPYKGLAATPFYQLENQAGIMGHYSANGDTSMIAPHATATGLAAGSPDVWPPMPPAGRTVTLAMLQRPADTILIGEQTNAHSSEIRIGAAIATTFPPASNTVQGLLFAGHNGGSHWIFADGHAKWLKATATARPGNNMWMTNCHALPIPQALTDRLRAVEQWWGR